MSTLDTLEKEYRGVGNRLMRPETIPPGEFARLASRQAELREILDMKERVERLRGTLQDHERVLRSDDDDLRAIAKEELPKVQEELAKAEENLRRALLPKDPHVGKDVVMEIRAGAGGDEASLFARGLFTMYARFAERRGWHTRLVSESRSDVGGYKEVIFEVVGKDAYGTLRLERGVHRIQRIPETEKTGRIHTSTATVAVLPKATDVEVEIRPEDLRIDTYRAGGHGGQKVQKTDSAVRITHLPTGLVVQCQDERSQQKNKERAMEVLRARLLALRIEEQARAQGAARRAQIGTGDRSEKIRTYNVPQNRVTDHRIKRSWHDVGRVLDGDLDGLVNDLQGAL